MITWADILTLETGHLILRLPEEIEKGAKITIVLRDGRFDLYADKTRIGRVPSSNTALMEAMRGTGLVGILEWPEGQPRPETLNRYATVVDKRGASETSKV